MIPSRVTAAVLIIGDEILSGRTADVNLNAIALFLAERGVDLAEARVVSDEMDEIVAAVNALRARYTYLITTGGIGPTHDDITADAIAKAFGAPLYEHPDILKSMDRPGYELNAARRRMTRVPTGGGLLANPVGGPPGFYIDNVFVLAGVPRIMRGMLEDVGNHIEGADRVQSRTLRVDTGEGVIAAPLESVARAHPQMSLGSYPFFENDSYGANLVLRGRDPAELDAAAAELEAVLAEVGVIGAWA
ncbi:MAG: competence/damage-inducible protein [Caulobacteraceae bacterium]|nr:competence/damage-inducible protein [Caulobacteraceae bacterium]